MNKLRNSLVIMVALAAVSFTSCSQSNDADAAAAQFTADSLAAAVTADSLAAVEAAAMAAADTTVVADSTVAE